MRRCHIRPNLTDGRTGSDINDLHTESGLQAVKDCIHEARQAEPTGKHAPNAETTTEATDGEWPKPEPLKESQQEDN